ncbi:MAG: hypothetical protein ACXWDO_02830 [Bacteroidia bacterium]
MKKFFYSVFAIAALLTSCEKSDHLHGEEDVLSPTIEITAPLPTDKYTVGDTIHIFGRMWDNNDLHEAGVFISNDHGNMMDCPMHVHATKEHHFDTCYVVNNANLGQTLKLSVKAEDHSHNKSEKTIDLLIE